MVSKLKLYGLVFKFNVGVLLLFFLSQLEQIDSTKLFDGTKGNLRLYLFHFSNFW